MKWRWFQVGLVIALAAAAAPAGEVIDRIVAVVNRAPVLQSQWDDAVAFEALAEGRRPETITVGERAAALQRLIDRTLIDQQLRASNYVLAAEPEIAAALQNLRRQIAPGATDEAWRALLARSGLTEHDVGGRVRQQVNQMRFIELRFRPSVRVSQDDIERYYRDQFLPSLRGAGGADRPLVEVSRQIEQILAEERVSTLLAAWLQSLRAQARINMIGAVEAAASAPAQRAEAADGQGSAPAQRPVAGIPEPPRQPRPDR